MGCPGQHDRQTDRVRIILFRTRRDHRSRLRFQGYSKVGIGGELAGGECRDRGRDALDPGVFAPRQGPIWRDTHAQRRLLNRPACDSGDITTSTITVPLVTALGVGLATSIRGRNPMIDGFGLIAFASLTPMIFVLAYGMVV